MRPILPGRRPNHAGRVLVSGLFAGLTLLFSSVVFASATNNTPRVAAIDWGQAQTLIAIGAPPVAMAQIGNYSAWVGGPAVPSDVRNLGLRAQPNMELLSQLDLDAITITPLYAGLQKRLAKIAPVKSIGIYNHNGSAWKNTVESTRKLGALVHRKAAAQRLIESTRATIRKRANRVPAHTQPLLVIQFIDARHVRVYGPSSLIGNVMQRMGVANAWHRDVNSWGFAQVPLKDLATMHDARVAIVRPIPVAVPSKVANSVLWQHLPAVRDRSVLALPSVWSYGGLPSATRFARGLADAYARLKAGKSRNALDTQR
ncbi:ABC transporter substrate-binding protein [Salinisphaera orenii]|uniref:ABC transporter substrate-binding protein n=1 Tax=Salinisphaera orenii TaxID=856731 RepID=UPI000DBEA4A8